MTKKIGRRRIFMLKSGFRVPASATPSQVDRVTEQKRDWVPERAVTSSQEGPNPASCLCHCFSNEDSFIDLNMSDVLSRVVVMFQIQGIALHKIPFF